ncbi:MAG: hypothetical protein ACRYGC_04210 [Janthinobacterium lividum]
MTWLLDPGNQKTLAFFGGGLAVVIGGLWAAFKFFRQKPATPSITTVTADHGGMAAGRDVNATPPAKP